MVEKLEEAEEVTAVMHTEDYIPPHKQAGFCPYDAVIAIQSPFWNGSDVEGLLANHSLEYDRVISVTENDSVEDGNLLAFISLAEYDP